MSWDLFLWDPMAHERAARMERACSDFDEAEESEPESPSIQSAWQELEERFPTDGDETPWTVSRGNRWMCIAVEPSEAVRARETIAAVARRNLLVLFDPQNGDYDVPDPSFERRSSHEVSAGGTFAASMSMFLEINGTRLYVERQGSGPTLLFIHGTTLDRRMWRPQVEAFAPRYDVITYDVRGFGKSAVPTGPFCHYQDAEALLDHLGVKRAVVVGHSSGGLYTLELAVARPDLVAGCGLVSAGLGGGVPFPAELIALVGELRTAAAERGVDAARAIWRSCILFASARETPSVRDELDAMLADYSGWGWLHGSPAGNLAPPVHERLESIAVPTVVIDGGRDNAYTRAIADMLSTRIPRAKLLRLPHAGHMANMEDPAAVTHALDELARAATITPLD